MSVPGDDHATRDDRQALLSAFADSGRTITVDEYRATARRSFLFGSAGAIAAVLGWRFVQNSPADDNIPSVLRGGLEFNEGLWSALYDEGRTVATYDVADATPLRVNGRRGLLDDPDVDGYRLRVEGPDGEQLDELTMDDVRDLGEEELVVYHKCIEGWSNITHWHGVPFARFAQPYLRAAGDAQYVGMTSIDGGYFVGLDLLSCLHPQVLLGTRLDGEPLTPVHGAPLRLVSPIHYGIKSIKQVATIRFTHDRPADYWAERGYDWHSQH